MVRSGARSGGQVVWSARIAGWLAKLEIRLNSVQLYWKFTELGNVSFVLFSHKDSIQILSMHLVIIFLLLLFNTSQCISCCLTFTLDLAGNILIEN